MWQLEWDDSYKSDKVPCRAVDHYLQYGDMISLFCLYVDAYALENVFCTQIILFQAINFGKKY